MLNKLEKWAQRDKYSKELQRQPIYENKKKAYESTFRRLLKEYYLTGRWRRRRQKKGGREEANHIITYRVTF